MAKSRDHIPVSFSIPRSVIERLDRLAHAHRRSRSSLVLDLIENGIDGHEAMVKLMGDPRTAKPLADAFTRPDVIRAITASMTERLSDAELSLFADRLEEVAQVFSVAPAASGSSQKRMRRGRGAGEGAKASPARPSKKSRHRVHLDEVETVSPRSRSRK